MRPAYAAKGRIPDLSRDTVRYPTILPSLRRSPLIKSESEWEETHNHPTSPIIALSANVLGDVYDECVKARFNSYISKPIEFKELSSVITKILDLVDAGKSVELLQHR